MEINEKDLKLIIESVLNKLETAKSDKSDKEVFDTSSVKTLGQDGIFEEINTAVDAAETAHLELIKLTLEKRREIIQSIRKIIISNLEEISKLAVEETTFGRVKDKIEKNRLAALKTPGIEDLEPTAYSDDNGMTLMERAAYGVIGSIIPSTNPTSTVINNSISMIAGGNSVVFNPHPMAKKSSCFTVSLINQAIIKAGGPPNVLCAIANPTIDSAQILMKHPKIKLLVVTGGPAVVKVAMNSSKKVIAAGPGNPPCVVDETADLVKAGRDIVNGAGFDNNIVCICEKEILAVSQIADKLKEEMIKNGAYELKGEQIEKVTKLVIADPGKPGHEGVSNKEYVGKDASIIARDIGLDISDQTKILLCEVDRYHPLVWTEQLLPVIPLVRFSNVDEAIDFAVQCEHNFGHTASIHSRNIAKLSKMAQVMNCSLFIKNGPNYSGLGFGGAGYASFTIATPTGEGLTRARTFTRERRCVLVGYFRIV
jgi:acyl-CoA reductase-like NAD-dependent aldehyde dehydrogenase